MIDLSKPLETLSGVPVSRIKLIDDEYFHAFFQKKDGEEKRFLYNKDGLFTGASNTTEYNLHLRNVKPITPLDALACHQELTRGFQESINKCDEALKNYLDKKPLVDTVNHPPHYTNLPAKCECGRTIECIDVSRHLNFNLGNALKYIWRCDSKDEPIENLKKAIWYLNDEINKRITL